VGTATKWGSLPWRDRHWSRISRPLTDREMPGTLASYERWIGQNDPMRVMPWRVPDRAWTAAKLPERQALSMEV
jgi:hypothetical protein